MGEILMTTLPNPVRGVLFDLDNTLYEYAPCNAAATQAVVHFLSSALNQPADRITTWYDQARDHVHQQLATQSASHSRLLYIHKLIELASGKSDITLAQQAEQLFWDTYFEQMQLRPGVIELLQDLTAENMRIAIVTDLTTAVQIRKIQHLKLDRYITALVTSEEVGVEKPDPSMITVGLRKLNLNADQVVLVGDSIEKDQAASRHAGIHFIHIQQDTDILTLRASLLNTTV